MLTLLATRSAASSTTRDLAPSVAPSPRSLPQLLPRVSTPTSPNRSVRGILLRRGAFKFLVSASAECMRTRIHLPGAAVSAVSAVAQPSAFAFRLTPLLSFLTPLLDSFDTTRAPDRYSQGGNLQYQQPPVPTSFVGAHRGSLPPQSQYAPPQQQHASSLHAGASFHPHGHQPVAPPHLPVPYASHSHHAHQPHTSAHHTAPPPPPTPPVPAFPPPVSSLLLYLFSPMEVTGPELGYSDRNAVDREGRHAPLFSGSPTRAHRSLSEEAYRVEWV